MAEFYQGEDGKVMAREAAGGTGGGVTSFATREATPAEATAWHEQQVAVTEAAAVAAKDAHKDHMEERAKVVAEEERAAADAAKAAGTPAAPTPAAQPARAAGTVAMGQPPAPPPPATNMGQQQPMEQPPHP